MRKEHKYSTTINIQIEVEQKSEDSVVKITPSQLDASKAMPLVMIFCELTLGPIRKAYETQPTAHVGGDQTRFKTSTEFSDIRERFMDLKESSFANQFSTITVRAQEPGFLLIEIEVLFESPRIMEAGKDLEDVSDNSEFRLT